MDFGALLKEHELRRTEGDTSDNPSRKVKKRRRSNSGARESHDHHHDRRRKNYDRYNEPNSYRRNDYPRRYNERNNHRRKDYPRNYPRRNEYSRSNNRNDFHRQRRHGGDYEKDYDRHNSARCSGQKRTSRKVFHGGRPGCARYLVVVPAGDNSLHDDKEFPWHSKLESETAPDSEKPEVRPTEQTQKDIEIGVSKIPDNSFTGNEPATENDVSKNGGEASKETNEKGSNETSQLPNSKSTDEKGEALGANSTIEKQSLKEGKTLNTKSTEEKETSNECQSSNSTAKFETKKGGNEPAETDDEGVIEEELPTINGGSVCKKSKDADYDLCIIYYGTSQEVARKYKNQCKYFFEKQGPKWQLVRHVLKQCFWKNYEYVWFPDDDLKISSDDIRKMFNVASEYGVRMGQPSLYDINVERRYANILVHRPDLVLHYTNFVEIMCPFFRFDALEMISRTIDNDSVKSGWGLDLLWPTMLDFKDIAVIDKTPLTHTRPQNAFNYESSFYTKYKIDPQRECFDLQQKYNLADFRKRSFDEVRLK